MKEREKGREKQRKEGRKNQKKKDYSCGSQLYD